MNYLMKINNVDFSNDNKNLTLQGYIYHYSEYREPNKVTGQNDSYDSIKDEITNLYDFTLTADVQDYNYKYENNIEIYNNYWKTFYSIINSYTDNKNTNNQVEFLYCTGDCHIYTAELSNIRMYVNFAKPFVTDLSNTNTTRWIFKYL